MSILTVTVPATERDLCTLAAVKLELGISGSGSDAELGQRIAQASAAIESYCGRVFARETVQEVFRGVAADQLMLARFPVASITSVTVGDVVLDVADYELDADAGLLWPLSGDVRSVWCASKITVLYVAGYILPDTASPTLPADIQRACIIASASSHLDKGRNPSIRSEGAQGVGQISFLDPRAGMEQFPPQVAAFLAPYRSFRA